MARTETHFIWTGDYAERLSNIERQAEAARRDETPLLAGEIDPLQALGEEYEALKREANEVGLRVVLRGLRDDEWDELVEAHPPRTDEANKDNDKALGFNEKTGRRDLIRAALVEPKFETRAQFDDWVREHDLSRGDITVLGMKAWTLTNGGGYTDPKLLPSLPPRDVEQS